MDTPRAHAPNTSECFLHVPFNQRWNPLETVIKEYYVDQGHTLTDLAKYMKDLYRFDASYVPTFSTHLDSTDLLPLFSERQYKYHLKKWDVGKTVPTSVKEEACTALGKRTRGATSTSTVEYNGERIGKAKLRRSMITLARQDNIVRLSQNVWVSQHFKTFSSLMVTLASSIGTYHTSSESLEDERKWHGFSIWTTNTDAKLYFRDKPRHKVQWSNTDECAISEECSVTEWCSYTDDVSLSQQTTGWPG